MDLGRLRDNCLILNVWLVLGFSSIMISCQEIFHWIAQESPDPQEARVLEGRREYVQGNLEDAARIFGAIDLRPILSRLQDSANSKTRHRRRSRAEAAGALSATLRTADILFEGIYLKAKCLQADGLLPGEFL